MTTLRMHIGGINRVDKTATGIHWHVSQGNRIEYIATDDKRQVIPFVRLDDGKGNVTEFFADGVTDAAALTGERRVLDCVDCHNRPSHTFAYSAERAVDAIAAGGFDTKMPFLRREAIRVLKAAYADKTAAFKGVEDGLASFYRDYPGVPKDALDLAVSTAKRLYERNVFPSMNVSWGSYGNMSVTATTLRPLRAWLQTAGLACPLERLAELSRALLAAGVTRIARPGEQVGGYFGGPHDGVYSLQRYARRVALELPASLQGITSFAELEAPPPLPADAATAPVRDKAAFLALPTDAAAAQLYFKSGASSGDPKVSVFSHAGYARQMRAAGDGLYATGLDPVRDRCMNLFFAGHLYGGFISFWSALEHLQAVQLPMTAR